MPGDRLAAFWLEEYERRFKFKPLFERKDGTLLHRLLGHYGRHSLAWCITRYLDDEHAKFVRNEDAGYGASVGGLYKRYVRYHARYVAREEGRGRVAALEKRTEMNGVARRLEQLSLLPRMRRVSRPS